MSHTKTNSRFARLARERTVERHGAGYTAAQLSAIQNELFAEHPELVQVNARKPPPVTGRTGLAARADETPPDMPPRLKNDADKENDEEGDDDEPMVSCTSCRGTGELADGSMCERCEGEGKVAVKDQEEDVESVQPATLSDKQLVAALRRGRLTPAAYITEQNRRGGHSGRIMAHRSKCPPGTSCGCEAAARSALGVAANGALRDFDRQCVNVFWLREVRS